MRLTINSMRRSILARMSHRNGGDIIDPLGGAGKLCLYGGGLGERLDGEEGADWDAKGALLDWGVLAF